MRVSCITVLTPTLSNPPTQLLGPKRWGGGIDGRPGDTVRIFSRPDQPKRHRAVGQRECLEQQLKRWKTQRVDQLCAERRHRPAGSDGRSRNSSKLCSIQQPVQSTNLWNKLERQAPWVGASRGLRILWIGDRFSMIIHNPQEMEIQASSK